MNVSRAWLQKYFDEELPNSEEIAEALTFHSSEVEEVVGDRLDVKILPDRAPYALSHRGVAYELAASLGRNLKDDPLRDPLPEYPANNPQPISVSIEEPEKCTRYMAALITGVSVGPSPDWLKEALESVGQRSINSVVDATNYVMLNIGQPLHAFDADKLEKKDNAYSIQVRSAQSEEKIITLTGEEYTLPEGTLLITDGANNAPLGIAGVKGGKAAEVTATTKSLIIESANFDGTSVRKTSQALKLWTDASLRFQNKISPELVAYGMRDVLALILSVAGGSVESVVDTYPNPEQPRPHVSITLERINTFLGTEFSIEDVQGALARLALNFVVEGETITVRPSFERRDITVWQDLTEEIGRVLGYDQVAATPLPPMQKAPNQDAWKGIERLKDLLCEHGYIEISTPSFAESGDIQLANPLQSEKPYLRSSLAENVRDALERSIHVAPRVLGVTSDIKLFELGTVFTNDGEHLSLCFAYQPLSGKPSTAMLDELYDTLVSTFPQETFIRTNDHDTQVLELSLKEGDVDFARMGAGYEPTRMTLSEFKPFSQFPSAIRDIAVWTPEKTEESEVALLIQKEAGDLLARMDLFDRFEKDGRVSYAFRLVFQSFDRTLADTDLDPIMESITNALNANEGWEVR